jgi:riboflavin biosynthesis pyrimidine reductase
VNPAEPVYSSLDWPEPPPDRPLVFINMISTLDGKIVSGERNQPVSDLGSAMDHATMHWLESQADAVLVGAATVRATPAFNYPANLHRFCATAAGRLDAGLDFFRRAPEGRAWAATSRQGAACLPPGIAAAAFGDSEMDWPGFFAWCRNGLGIGRMVCEGGGELNAALLAEDLVDELFLTLAPKIKGGRDMPTLAEGEPFPREELPEWRLSSCVAVGSEVFLRYRRHR